SQMLIAAANVSAEAPVAPPAQQAANDSSTVPPTPGYVGEPPVDPQWLRSREAALVAVRTDYEAARAQAEASGGAGPGWTAAVLVTDESGQTYSPTNAPLAQIFDSDAAPVLAGFDESGPVYKPATHWLEFNEDAFAASYRARASAQAGTPLQALAAQYGTDAASLLAQNP